MNAQHSSHNYRSANSRSKWVLLAFFAIAGFFLLTEHRAHVFGFMPYALLAACLLMHFFHGNHGGPEDAEEKDSQRHEGEHK